MKSVELIGDVDAAYVEKKGEYGEMTESQISHLNQGTNYVI